MSPRNKCTKSPGIKQKKSKKESTQEIGHGGKILAEENDTPRESEDEIAHDHDHGSHSHHSHDEKSDIDIHEEGHCSSKGSEPTIEKNKTKDSFISSYSRDSSNRENEGGDPMTDTDLMNALVDQTIEIEDTNIRVGSSKLQQADHRGRGSSGNGDPQVVFKSFDNTAV